MRHEGWRVLRLSARGVTLPGVRDHRDEEHRVRGDRGGVFALDCEHVYHTACLRQWFNQRKRCPQCQKEFGRVIGVGPRTGTLEWFLDPSSLPGHEDSKQMIVIQFDFPRA